MQLPAQSLHLALLTIRLHLRNHQEIQDPLLEKFLLHLGSPMVSLLLGVIPISDLETFGSFGGRRTVQEVRVRHPVLAIKICGGSRIEVVQAKRHGDLNGR